MRRTQPLIIVIPGIGGSVLSNHREVVWGDGMAGLYGLLRHPERLAIDEPLVARTLTSTIGFIAPFKIPGYEGLIKSLQDLRKPPLIVDVATEGARRRQSADIVLFPYDFRMGVEHAAVKLAMELNARLGDMAPSVTDGMVIVVAHSMGGLVARRWAMEPKQRRLCRAIVTLGTPHRGAPKALDWLVNGVGIGASLPRGSRIVQAVSRDRLRETTELLRTWPGTYDLLPTYKVLEYEGLHFTAAELNRHVSAGFAATKTFDRESNRARGLHADIEGAWAQSLSNGDGGPETIPFFTRGNGTPHFGKLMQDGAVEFALNDPWWQPNRGWLGDGTVPAIAAVPHEMSGNAHISRWHVVGDRHAPMASAPHAARVVQGLIGQSLDWVLETVRTPEFVGVDIADSYALGEPIELASRIPEKYWDGAIVPRTSVRWAPPDGRLQPHLAETFQTGPGVAESTFTPPTEGMWRFRLSLQGPSGEDLAPPVTDTVAVVNI